MKPNYTESEWISTKSNDLLSCICYNCEKPFITKKKHIKFELNNNVGYNKFCSQKCKWEYQKKLVTVKCSHCQTEFLKKMNQFKRSQNHFCSLSCAAKYRNLHKVQGNRRSKLEMYIEEELRNKYSSLYIDYNKSDTINAELDIYIPSLKLAFELNGIFHYEPIYGQDKLDRTQNNDNRKFQACLEREIELCIIDTSQQKLFKKSTSIKYLNIVTEIIDKKLGSLEGL